MTNLSNGCKSSKISVHPKNWASKSAKINSDWYISYRFYDPLYPKPKHVVIKGMNRFKSLPDRQNYVRDILTNEMDKLLNKHYNPFKSQDKHLINLRLMIDKDPLNHSVSISELSPCTPIKEALDFSFRNLSVSTRTKRDIKFMLTDIKKAIDSLNLQDYEVSKVSRKVIKMILELASNSNDRYNKNRSYLMILFSELCEFEAVEINPVRDIKKKKILRRIRVVLTKEERTLVNDYLLTNYPEFHRFLHIFFHSGARISELLRLKRSDIDLGNQRYKLIIQKGREYKEVYKTIKNIALPYWENLVINCQTEDFIFSKGLKPGSAEIQPYQITKRWYRLVKLKLGIKADFYSLKHLHTTEVVDILSENDAAKHNDHTSTAMVVGIYDVNRVNRQHNAVKTVGNTFE
jgi:integrase